MAGHRTTGTAGTVRGAGRARAVRGVRGMGLRLPGG